MFVSVPVSGRHTEACCICRPQIQLSHARYHCCTLNMCKATSSSAPLKLRWCTRNRRRRLQQRRQSRHSESTSQTRLSHRRRHTQHRESQTGSLQRGCRSQKRRLSRSYWIPTLLRGQMSIGSILFLSSPSPRFHGEGWPLSSKH